MCAFEWPELQNPHTLNAAKLLNGIDNAAILDHRYSPRLHRDSQGRWKLRRPLPFKDVDSILSRGRTTNIGIKNTAGRHKWPILPNRSFLTLYPLKTRYLP